MAGANLVFSKVVATPTDTAWSQAYSAGSLFAAISLQTNTTPQAENQNLANLGKDLISTLESEFFTLETKDLESIKQAITTTFARVNENISQSFVICYLNENILYLYASGEGKAVLKRGEKIGTVLEGESGNNIKSASGYVQPKDIIILQTRQFLKIISSPTLASSLDKNIPSEITEELAPHIHERAEGGASAIILSYNEGILSPEDAAGIAAATAATAASTATNPSPTKSSAEDEENLDVNPELNGTIDDEETSQIETPPAPLTPPAPAQPEEISEIIRPETATSPINDRPIENPAPKNLGQMDDLTSPYYTPQKSKRKFGLKIGLGGFGKLSRSRKIILLVGIVLLTIILIASILAVMNMRNSNNQELFDAVYNEAKAKYDEGQSLMELNQSLAQENLREAQAILQENVNTFPQGSDLDQQIEDLLAQVNTALGSDSSGSSNSTPSQASEVNKSESQILSVAIDNPNASYFTQNEDFIFFINNEGVNRLDKGNSEEEVIIDEDWEEAGGIGVFGSNVYVLDKTENIFKFVPSGSNYTKSNYITSSADLEDSADMSIDGSIYVLTTDGNITKYTKGAEDTFSITGLEKPLSSPTKIVTAEEMDNIYVLDKGNSRIVVLDKDGKFVKAYSADIIKNAREIDPQESDNAIYVLSGDKVYKISTN